MKKLVKSFLSIILVFAILFGAAPLSGFKGVGSSLWKGLCSLAVSAKEGVEEIIENLTPANVSDNTLAASGQCGDNVYWSFNSSTGALTISGTGKMYNYDYYSNPQYGPFYNNSSIKSVTIESGVTSIGKYTFYYCSSLTSIEIPDSVTSIGNYAFYYCSSLTSIEIPDSVTSIGYDAFYDTAYYKNSSNWENGVLYIGNHLIKAKTSISGSYVIKGGTKCIGNEAFRSCSSLTSIEIPDSVTSIGKYAFSGCRSLTSIEIPDSVTSIGFSAFKDCYSLTSVTIGNSVTSIGWYAFEYCRSLTSITIPDSVTSIGGWVFWECRSLTSVTIPDSVTSIGEDAFVGCRSLTSITVDNNNNNYSSDSFGVLYNKDKTELIQYTIGNERTSFTIPNSVTSIGNYAFYSCSKLTSIDIPDSVTSIGNWAFYDCYKLKDVYYSGSQQQWNKISIGSDNYYLTNATIHYNSTGSTIDDCDNEPISFVIDKKTGSTVLNFKQAWFTNGSSTYNHNLAQLCSQFVMIGYDDGKKPNLEKALKAIGMDGIEIQPNAGQEEVNYYIANRKINVGSNEFYLVFTGFIGSHHAQWYSNFDPGTGATHKGFNNAKNYVMGKLKNYVDNLADNYSVPKNKIKFLICGHSRGAATANLVAADLIKNEQYAYKDNIYTYAFATPNSTTSPERKEAQYKRIFNIVNPEDFVTKVMLVGWGYGRYGTTYVLPSLTNTKNSKYKTYYNKMQNLYSDFTAGGKYTPYASGEHATYKVVTELWQAVPFVSLFYSIPLFAGPYPVTPYYFFHNTLCHFVSKEASAADMVLAGTLIANTLGYAISSVAYRDVLTYFIDGGAISKKFAEAHSANTYCAYTMSMSEKQMKEERKGYLNAVNCPVDVEVYDKETEELVGRIVNNVVDEEIAAKDNSVVMVVDGDKKEFWLPSDGNYEVKLIGNDNGTMDYSVSEIDVDSAETKRVNFFDVPIENGKAYEAEINEITTLDDYKIESPTGNDVAPTENMVGDEIISYNINISTEGDGYATNGMTVTSGERVTLEATPEEGANFLGWYENGKKISSESTIDFVAKSDRNITAKFSEKVLPSVKGVSIGNFSIDYKSSKTITPYITADEGASYTVTYKSSNPSVATVDGNGKVTSQKQSGFNRGSTVITCTVTDSIGNTVSDTCKVSVQYAWWQWLIKIVLLGFIWY